MEIIAELIDNAISNYENEMKLEQIKHDVKNLCTRFPLYAELKN